MATTIGVDIGGLKTMLVAQDADIVLTNTGSISRPTLISFFERSRLVGEEAAPQISGDSTLIFINLLIGKQEQSDHDIAAHRRLKVNRNEKDELFIETSYCSQSQQFTITSLLGIFLAKLWERIVEVHGPDSRISFSLPPSFDISVARAVKEAAIIAGIDVSRISFADASDCIVATYGRKLQALRPAEKSHLEGKKAVLVEMGHTQSTITVVNIGSFDDTVTGGLVKASCSHDPALGGIHFDMKLFSHFASVCATKHSSTIEPGTKKGQRLLVGCERLRKLLSQLGDAKITVENLTDAGDVSFTMRRDEFASLCSELLERFKALIRSALASAGITAEDMNTIGAIELVGGGVRMPSVQAAIMEILGDSLPLGAKFDDASVALGAALVSTKASAAALAKAMAAISAATSTVGGDGAEVAAAQPESELEPVAVPILHAVDIGTDGSHGLSSEDVDAARARELAMQATDMELTKLLAVRNSMEAYILEMRSAKRRKHGDLIDGASLESLLNENETWMWDNAEANLAELEEKDQSLRQSIQGLCGAFFEATEADRLAVEQQLTAEAAIAEAEREQEGDETTNVDRDNRRLKKEDRMRLAVKNKDEGTELFKGGNFRQAAARYSMAMGHCAKFFDLSPQDEIEVKSLKTTLYLNLASCYIKLENWPNVERNCDDALALDPDNVKAYFRRSSAFEAKKQWDKALADIKKCQLLSDVEDKMVTKAADRIKKEIQKEKDKEKKMWGKAFA